MSSAILTSRASIQSIWSKISGCNIQDDGLTIANNTSVSLGFQRRVSTTENTWLLCKEHLWWKTGKSRLKSTCTTNRSRKLQHLSCRNHTAAWLKWNTGESWRKWASLTSPSISWIFNDIDFKGSVSQIEMPYNTCKCWKKKLGWISAGHLELGECFSKTNLNPWIWMDIISWNFDFYWYLPIETNSLILSKKRNCFF